jgi:hypothetical protein
MLTVEIDKKKKLLNELIKERKKVEISGQIDN